MDVALDVEEVLLVAAALVHVVVLVLEVEQAHEVVPDLVEELVLEAETQFESLELPKPIVLIWSSRRQSERN